MQIDNDLEARNTEIMQKVKIELHNKMEQAKEMVREVRKEIQSGIDERMTDTYQHLEERKNELNTIIAKNK